MRWAKMLGLAVLAEVALVASAVLFMLFYSSAIHPGENAAFYDAQARVLLPYVAIGTSFPLFYWMSRWCDSWRFAQLFWGLHVAIDASISLGADGVNALFPILPFWLVSQAAKLLGCWFGCRNRPR